MEPSGVLNAELFEDEGAYNEAATELVMDRSSRERLIRPIIAIICGNLIDGTARQRGLGRNARKWRQDVGEAWGSGYIYTISESWDEFDRDEARALLNESLRGEQALRARLGTEPISPENVDNRVTCAIVGIERLSTLERLGDTIEASDREPWVPLYNYVRAQPSAARVAHLQSIYAIVSRAFVKEKHLDAHHAVTQPAWQFGVGAGVLDIMGEMPESSPG